MQQFQSLRTRNALHWDSQYEGLRYVGQGGQGVVYHCERAGVDGFRIPIALKAFSPNVYASASDYISDMGRMAEVAMHVSQLQCHQLLNVHNFIEDDGIRVMVMEWVNGYDLRHLLHPVTLTWVGDHLSDSQKAQLNDVVITKGFHHSRLKPGIAIQILRESLTGLASLHRVGVAHGDIKPSNVMVNQTGDVQLVDLGSAVDMEKGGARTSWTPAYAAVEILDGAPKSAQTDLASLGFVLVEMLAGCRLFKEAESIDALREAKQQLPDRLQSLLPSDVARNKDLVSLCQGLIHPDPGKRIATAEEANLVRAADLHRQLVKTGLDSEYANDLRVLMEQLPNSNPTENTEAGIEDISNSMIGDAATIPM